MPQTFFERGKKNSFHLEDGMWNVSISEWNREQEKTTPKTLGIVNMKGRLTEEGRESDIKRVRTEKI